MTAVDHLHCDEATRQALNAAGYCGEPYPPGGGSCTRRPGHDGDHVDSYYGRKKPTDTEGYRRPQL
ncbi:hypothetical protein ACF1BS_07570 [Streptomyces sp. NPDC014748]|uniref:hypothetical protein n=1 Tax=Streptomyces sp. NPDC014748 TaxID=3364905 RepID=UPI003700F2D0